MSKFSIILGVFIWSLTFQFVFGQDFRQPQKSDYPDLPASGKNLDDFVPKGWTVVGKACGDLNRDKSEDCALVIKGNHGKFLNKTEGLGADPFDTNPRILAVLFKDAAGYQLVRQSNTFIIPPDSPTMDEPFQELTIKNGVLQLDFNVWYSAGSWSSSRYSYKFKFQNGDFVLIGADRTESMRNTGEMESQSYNFLTGRVKITKGNFTEDNKDKISWKTYKIKKLKTFDTFPAPLSWQINADYSL